MSAAKKGELVPRPAKKVEYEIRFATADSRKGWPLETTPTNYRLKGELGTVFRGGRSYERWQHKPTAKGTARIWFYVDEHTVYLEQVHTSHPNATK